MGTPLAVVVRDWSDLPEQWHMRTDEGVLRTLWYFD